MDTSVFPLLLILHCFGVSCSLTCFSGSICSYHPVPIVFSQAKGSSIWDPEGNKYLDFLSAYSAVNQVIDLKNIIHVPLLRSQLLDFGLVENGYWSEEASDFNMGTSEQICKSIDDQ